MPVLGYLLILNEKVGKILTNRFDAALPFGSELSMWRIYMLYYGGILLAIGSILFALLCPAQIKQYATAFRMVDAERNHLTAHNQTKQISTQLAALYARMTKRENAIFNTIFKARLLPDLHNLGVGTHPDLQSGDQWGLGLIHIWNLNDIKRPIWRIAVLFLFTFGLALLAIPAIFTFAQVTFLLAKHLLGASVPDFK